MCAVSMVLDYGRRTAVEDYTVEHYRDLWRMVEEAKKYDTKRGEKDCEDPEKVEFLKRIVEHLERIEKRLDSIEAQAELDRINRVLGPQPQPNIMPIVIDPTPLDPFGYVGGLGGFIGGGGPGIGLVAGQPYVVTSIMGSDDEPTLTIGETHDEAWARKSVGYCPKCGSQWVEAPCADPEHRRRRYEF